MPTDSNPNRTIPGRFAVTPGVGFRYKSPVGPVRVDMGINPRRVEKLAVVTSTRDSTGTPRLVELRNEQRDYVSGGTATGFWKMFNRVVVHLSIGQAY